MVTIFRIKFPCNYPKCAGEIKTIDRRISSFNKKKSPYAQIKNVHLICPDCHNMTTQDDIMNIKVIA